ncbi:protein adenylyltransferase SelO family protein [Corynebacterium tapiri]|uniref:YdiU family protein n=1 Tax=Corynebacterium tapiri TaxID=1448266 RepID=A0A5C4U693_9CORY|nr:protein adenylyltransferase SelO family protein [Corynebacterium tapiri]TNL99277.1 hypothetical protein FHE74_02670 [Corynebacterium tapiri]
MFEHTFADTLPELATEAKGEEHPDARLILLNDSLARELGLDPDWLQSTEGVQFLTGHGARAVAMGYAGHQFGSYNPQLGDGRALLIGETKGHFLHAKGTGPTPYSRRGDGRGTLTSMLREYLFCEAMHALGVPTTRALAVLTTGRTVVRENGPEAAGIGVRVARGLTRVGTYQYARTMGLEKRLCDYDIARLKPGASYAQFLETVRDSQVATVTEWMRVGFVHGVMNTDNTSITGETLDYGPCAFTEDYSPDSVYSSIDTAGRYRFGNQPLILKWNMFRLAETLVELIDIPTLERIANETVVPEVAPSRGLYPRNDLVDKALRQVREGDLGPYLDLLESVSTQKGPAPGPVAEDFGPFVTYCGT